MIKSNNFAAESVYQTPAMEILEVISESPLTSSKGVIIDDLDDVEGEWDA